MNETQERSLSTTGYSYRKLDIWERSQVLAVRVITIARALTRDPGMSVIARQLVGSAGSIGANIAEGHGRFSRAAYANHLSIAKGSASEVGSWLNLLRRLDEIAPETEYELQAEVDSAIGLLKYKIRTLTTADRDEKARARRTKPVNPKPESV
jgi:four helix bundle protein